MFGVLSTDNLSEMCDYSLSVQDKEEAITSPLPRILC